MNQIGFWLLPEKKIQAVYQKLTTPKFEPHITLTSAVAAKGQTKSTLATVAKVVNNLKPVPVELSEVSLSTTYFQCVFARVKPSLEIFTAHQLIKSVVKHSNPNMYVPHLSLIYGNLDLAQRFKIAESIKLPVTKFLADRICAVNADSLDPKTWTKMAEFELKS